MRDRITEKELRIAALKLLAKAPGGFMTTSELIIELADMYRPEGEDAEILYHRSDTKFSQKVRNLTGSHRDRKSSLVGQGYATYSEEREGLTITDAGRAFVKSLGD